MCILTVKIINDMIMNKFSNVIFIRKSIIKVVGDRIFQKNTERFYPFFNGKEAYGLCVE